MTEQTGVTDEGWQWAIVEIMGRRKHFGRTREEERFGAKMLRIDVPNDGDPANKGWTTTYYGGSSIFSFSLTDEASVMKANRPYERPSLTYYREPRSDWDGDDEQDAASARDPEPVADEAPATPAEAPTS